MINIESICKKCLKKDGCQTYKELKEVTEIYLVDGCEKYIKNVNEALNKIRAEIEQEIIPRNSSKYDYEAKWQNLGLRMALKVIDKYREDGE